MRAGVKIFFEGGCRPPPVGMATAVVVGGRSDVRLNLGPGSSMDAEWLALLHSVEVAGAAGIADAIFVGDALAVIGQATGAVRCPPAFAQHRDTLHRMIADPRIRYVKRSQNLAGIALARAMDA